MPEIAESYTVRKALEDDEAVLLDVRTADEILATGHLKTTRRGGGLHQWMNVSCKPDACPLLEMTACNLLTRKDAPVIIYCRSGRRAGKAKEILDGMGYKKVINAGGWDHVTPFNTK